MLTKLGEIAGQENLDIAFWEDGLKDKLTGSPYNKTEVFPSNIDVYVYVWATVWEWRTTDNTFEFANLDYKVRSSSLAKVYLISPTNSLTFLRSEECSLVKQNLTSFMD